MQVVPAGALVRHQPREKKWATRVSRFVKAGLKRAGVSYKELARRLNEHGLQETEDSITSKLGWGPFAVTFFLATLAALQMEGVRLENI